jgi:hypothetical protein
MACPRYLGTWLLSPGLCFPVLGVPQSPRLIVPSDNQGSHSVFSVVFVLPGRFLRKNAAWRSPVSVHSLCTYMGELRKPIPLGVSRGVCYFWAVSLAKIKLGFLCVRSEAPGTIPGPPLICVELLYILDENLTFMIYHYIFLCLGAAPGSSLSMAFWLPSVRSRSFVGGPGASR